MGFDVPLNAYKIVLESFQFLNLSRRNRALPCISLKIILNTKKAGTGVSRSSFNTAYMQLFSVITFTSSTRYVNPLKCSGVRQLHLKVFNTIQV